ncbi:restriction endonuclease subunit S [Methanohalophilus sp. WG1-DM]|uniref:restriction endonuclease subunit S n=1 Tax=Methanohalophilus sp. WG1-DM TaxID=2491675 RepID=UPI000FFF25E6|nr:restriction endonuclease subunit S [Methanohalophilus sp. WG1-DM]RXG35027.1 type I restriction enzyme, S subunit [Methanohalophilus sp. WG1-DM]
MINCTIANLAQNIKISYTPSPDEDLPYVGLEHVVPNELHLSSYSSSTKIKSNKYKFKKGDILFGTLRPYFRKLIIAPFDGVCSTEFSVIRAKDENEKDFLFYVMAQNSFIDYATKRSNGARPRTKWKLFSDFGINVSSKQERIKIGNILSIYDYLINNNQRRIELLEQAAHLLYKEWFVNLRFPGHEHTKIVDGVPEGWEKKPLFEISEPTYGHAFKSNLFNEEGHGLPVARIRDIPAGKSKTFSEEEAPKDKLLYYGDFVIGMDGDFHMNFWNGGKSWINQRVVKLSPKKGYSTAFIRYAVERSILFLNQTITGTTVKHLGAKHLKKIEILVPPNSLLILANEILESFRKQILTLNKQNQNAVKARDLLLPKLMSGEISV